jgi:hypothetical protein
MGEAVINPYKIVGQKGLTIMDDFSKYEQMRDEGQLPTAVYRRAKADGLDNITLLRLLRLTFKLSLAEAKEVMIVGDRVADSLDVYQQDLASKTDIPLEKEPE